MNNDDSPSGARHESPLDLAIDRAVRQMMHVDPPAGLRRRVLARLTPRPSRGMAFFPRFAMAAGALAMLVLAVFVMRSDAPGPAPDPSAPAAVAQTSPSPSLIREPAPTSAAADPTPRRTAARSVPGAHSEVIRMPKIRNVFGSRSPAVTATNASPTLPDTVFPPAGAGTRVLAPGDAGAAEAITIAPLPVTSTTAIPPAQSPADTALPPSAQLLNIRLELRIGDPREGMAAAVRTVTMLLQDRENGRLRTDEGPGHAKLGVDARPEILANGRIRVLLTLEYRPQAVDGQKALPSTLTESVTAILEDGKPLLLSQSGDSASDLGAVKVELKATVLR
jgi:hypothetical protein